MTVAASATAEKKTVGHRSSAVSLHSLNGIAAIRPMSPDPRDSLLHSLVPKQVQPAGSFGARLVER